MGLRLTGYHRAEVCRLPGRRSLRAGAAVPKAVNGCNSIIIQAPEALTRARMVSQEGMCASCRPPPPPHLTACSWRLQIDGFRWTGGRGEASGRRARDQRGGGEGGGPPAVACASDPRRFLGRFARRVSQEDDCVASGPSVRRGGGGGCVVRCGDGGPRGGEQSARARVGRPVCRFQTCCSSSAALGHYTLCQHLSGSSAICRVRHSVYILSNETEARKARLSFAAARRVVVETARGVAAAVAATALTYVCSRALGYEQPVSVK